MAQLRESVVVHQEPPELRGGKPELDRAAQGANGLRLSARRRLRLRPAHLGERRLRPQRPGDLEELRGRFLAQGGSSLGHDLLGAVLAAQGRGEEREFKQALLGDLAYEGMNDPTRAQEHRVLYHRKLKAEEERVAQVRRSTGLSTDGMQP